MAIHTLLFIALGWAGHPAAAQPRPAIRSNDLLAMDPIALVRLLDNTRPAPVSSTVRAQVIASVPKHGRVDNLDEGERRKLAALAKVLEAAQRASVYAVMVIDVPQARVGLYARTVILISRPALTLMSEQELQAVVAHETAHEYVHAEYERAMAAGGNGRLHDLELVCDIIAVTILHAMGQEARPLASAIEKLLRFNHSRFGTEIDDAQYPSPLLRRSMMLALEKRLWRGRLTPRPR